MARLTWKCPINWNTKRASNTELFGFFTFRITRKSQSKFINHKGKIKTKRVLDLNLNFILSHHECQVQVTRYTYEHADEEQKVIHSYTM